MASSYLEATRKQFQYYKQLGERAFAQVADDQLQWQPHAESNSIATIIKHLWGNMLSRWTDFLHADGEKPWRARDAEFLNDLDSREAVSEKWEAGWKCLFDALDLIGEGDLETIVYIRNQGHTVTEAIQRQLAHYAYHVGQIVFLSKLLAGEGWNSLSIPRNRSAQYNAEKFSEEKARKHFTDDLLKTGE